MIGLIFGQFSLWAILIIGSAAIWGLSIYFKRDKGIAGAINAGFLILVFCLYGFGIRYGTEVDDFCVINGHVTASIYEEPWTEEYYETESYASGRDSKGNTTYSTRTVRRTRYHGPNWSAHTTVGEFDIASSRYGAFVRRFGNEVQTGSRHGGQCSYGDGRTYKTRWQGTASTLVPWSSTHSTINWMKASKGTVEKRSGGNGFTVPPYPGLVESDHGPRQPRVISAMKTYPSAFAAWKQAMDWDMDVLADRVGESKQANPIFIVTDQGMGFVEALRDQWINGKKNDVIVIVGVSQWPMIEWSDVLCWTKNQAISPVIKTGLSETDLNDRAKVMGVLATAIERNYQRQRMAEFEYLKNDIEIPGWISWTSFASIIAACAAVMVSHNVPTYAGFRPRF